MKKTIVKLLVGGSVVAAALLPLGANALTYYPGYTCYYRDISGSCLSYQISNPHVTGASYGASRSIYGNRLTYPFNTMFNASSVNVSPWDNRYGNRYNYGYYRYEEDDDDNDYVDEDDDNYRYDYIKRNAEKDGDWRWYYDEDDDRVRPYRYQSGDEYDDYDYYRGYGDGRYEYEHTKIYCEGRDCDTTHYRY